ncbi:urease accessory protein UreD [Geminocystis sp. NIES-3709]|uniref:urease accessory protein UreD n=1 Tax=Geminocystis sp. NIES-3709 TaxID=1617448 RepID=UPI0005FC6CED|nr:urease accessory protein UreD [Geminocystis sp. NIES-3709]BAQ65199.1 urease accessory protein UreD [Geminocystis sp. NIES-3709]
MSGQNWQGKINLVYEYQEGKTKIKSAYHQAPLKIQRSFYPEGDSICHSVILHTAGGIVGGDILSQTIHLSSNSQVFITTPAATKIYRTQEKKAFQEIIINLENDTYLEYLPQETIVFNKCQYQQKLRVNLRENATWLGWEIIRFGRSARGEIFTHGQWLNQTEVWYKDKPLWIDRQLLQGESNLFSAINGLANKPVIGNLTLISAKINQDIIREIRELIESKFTNLIICITTLQQGLLCRYHGNSVSEAKTCLTAIWQLLRAKYGLNSLIKPRYW